LQDFTDGDLQLLCDGDLQDFTGDLHDFTGDLHDFLESGEQLLGFMQLFFDNGDLQLLNEQGD
jgi:hypothetical protein